jgi:diadenosine tetraphosphate (Ap4A) HIT family hydrolase
MPDKDCPFCNISDDRIVASNDLALAICDNFPVSPGHMLFIPRRHIANWFDATEQEQIAIMRLINQFQKELVLPCEALAEQGKRPPKQDKRPEPDPPDAYNIGINIGPAAGQTVMHLHVHLIPRYEGDTDDPRGGVRWVLPGKAKYWE